MTAIICARNDPVETTNQTHLDLIKKWATKWRIKINPDTSVYVQITLHKTDPRSIDF